MTDASVPVPVPVLLLSGAGLSPWVWDDVRARLGVPAVVAPRPGGRASLADYAQAALESAPDGRFAVVGHSVGGLVATELLRRAPDRVTAFLAVSAVIPPPGGSFVSAMPAPDRWLLGLALRLAGTRPPEKALRRGLTEGLDPATASRVVAGFVPESRALYLDGTTRGGWDGASGYLVTTRDRELPPARQEGFARRLGATWQDRLATGHLPMLEDAGATVRSIERFLREAGAGDGRPA